MSDQPTLIRDAGTAVAKTIPPITLYALTLNDWLAVAGIAYLVLQAAYLLWKWNREVSARAADRAAIARLMQGPIANIGDKAPRERP